MQYIKTMDHILDLIINTIPDPTVSVEGGLQFQPALLDYNDFELLNFVTENVTKFLKNKNCYVFTIDPNIIEVERDTFAEIVENGSNNYKVIESLKKLGYTKSEKDVQIKWTYVLDINGRNSEEIFKTFKQNTRNIISRTINKFKLNIRTISCDELDEFKKITEDTCLRRGFKDKDITYYQNMKKAFGDNIVFKIAELNCEAYLNTLLEEVHEKRDESIGEFVNVKVKKILH